MKNENDILAVIFIMGGSSYGRASTEAEAVKNAVRAFVGDWASMFDVFGQPVPVNVVNVTGFDCIQFGHNGIYSDDNETRHQFDIERVITVNIPKLRKNGNKYGAAYRRKLEGAIAEGLAA
jgi:hypothetical protein